MKLTKDMFYTSNEQSNIVLIRHLPDITSEKLVEQILADQEDLQHLKNIVSDMKHKEKILEQ
jgi:hypothetical protein